MSAEIRSLDGTVLTREQVDADEHEALAKIFDELAVNARAGAYEGALVVMLRSESSFSVRYFTDNMMRLLGAVEAAKHDILETAFENDGDS